MRWQTTSGASADSGFALLDALIATAVVITVTSGVATLLTWSTRAAWVAGTQTIATLLARQKIEQLTALEWAVDGDGVLHSDLSASVAVDPIRETGPGLRPSLASTIDDDTPEYVDYVAGDGRWCGNRSPPAAGAAFVRRWSVVPLPSDPLNTLIFTVSVRPLSEASRSSRAASSGATLRTVRTRLFQ
jgi:hypothetical protein